MDEAGQVFMEAIIENFVDATVAEALENFAGEALGFIGVIAGAGVADGAEARLHFGDAITDGAGMLGVENEHFGHAGGLDGGMILAVICLVGTDRF